MSDFQPRGLDEFWNSWMTQIGFQLFNFIARRTQQVLWSRSKGSKSILMKKVKSTGKIKWLNKALLVCIVLIIVNRTCNDNSCLSLVALYKKTAKQFINNCIIDYVHLPVCYNIFRKIHFLLECPGLSEIKVLCSTTNLACIHLLPCYLTSLIH